MKELIFKGKTIYTPSGKASEYGRWACNFYTGCSNNCTYCYCKKGVMAGIWSDTPKLKKCLKDEYYARGIFHKELLHPVIYDGLKRYGLFFTFTSDPCLPETFNLYGFNSSKLCFDICFIFVV